MADNQNQQDADNSDQQTDTTQQTDTQTQTQDTTQQTQTTTSTFTWKDKLNVDIKNSPTLQKFEDTPEGLQKAVESHLNLEKLLGHEKVPIPKDVNDKEGWARFNKAMGIPDKPEGYSLKDVAIPEGIKDISFDKKTFAQTIHKYGLTPNQASGLWGDYTQLGLQAYQKAMDTHQTKLNELVNTLRQTWGDAYDSNVELGQLVLNKFADDQETNDWLTATFTKDPRGVKFLAKIGNQFAENKVGEFSYTRFAFTPEQAETELQKIRNDPNHPYLNPKATDAEHTEAVAYVNRLEEIVLKAKQG